MPTRIIQQLAEGKKQKMRCMLRFLLPAFFFLSACLSVSPAPQPAPIKIGLVVMPGPISDGTLNQLAISGTRSAAEANGAEFAFRETSSPRDIEPAIESLATEGFTHIVVAGPLGADATALVAAGNPSLTFSVVNYSFDPAIPNVQGLIFREDQSAYLAGALAGMFSRSKIVGVVAGRDVPRVRKYRNGFERGVNAVCPACAAIGVYVNSASDRAGGTMAAKRQIAAGADIIFGVDGETGEAAIVLAARQGFYVIGAETDAYLTTFAGGSAPGADRVLTSAINRADVAVRASIEARLRGSFDSGTFVSDASNGGIGLAPFHALEASIPAATVARLAGIAAGLAHGSIDTHIDQATGAVK
ncbi:MAG: BMP family ABC transporter substrate-binding protein [Chloroflexi bacterium]|nr:BMP family ABC transporter substrate-binding protein [Chloroflexota bacterium]